MINGIYLKLGSLLANYDVKLLSKFGGNWKNGTNSTSHSLRYPGGYRFVRPVTKGLRIFVAPKLDTSAPMMLGFSDYWHQFPIKFFGRSIIDQTLKKLNKF